MELEEAVKLLPDNVKIRQDAEALRENINMAEEEGEEEVEEE